MKNLLAFLALLALSNLALAQTDNPQDTSYWKNGFTGLLTFNQASYSNWQAGGENSISLNTLLNFFGNYQKGRIIWENGLDIGYGFLNTKSNGSRKTDDKLFFLTNFGYRIKKEGKGKLFWSTSLSFYTQFAKGFEYPNDTIKISDFMAPAYIVLNTGLEYKFEEDFSIIYAPLAGKWTIVNDDSLSARGAFGVPEGEKVRSELGTTFRLFYKKEIIKNVHLNTKLGLFTNYKENFGRIDVNWENIFLLKVNDIITTNLVLHFIYDDDINIPQFDDEGNLIGAGPRLQIKQLFGLGINVKI